MEVVAVVLFIAFAVLVLFFGHWQKKKRRELMQRIAVSMNARFSERDPYELADRHEPRFPTLRTGSRRYAFNVVHGRLEGRPFWLFDHHYETYSHDKNGRKTHHHYRTFLLRETELDFAPLEARPEGFFDKMKAAFGFDDIDFASAEFSRKWHIGSPDREFAYAVFTPQMIEYFLGLRGLRMSTAGAFALFRLGSGRMDEQEMADAIRISDGFFERLPRYLKKDIAR